MIHEGRENNKESKGGFCRARRSGPRSQLMEYQNKAFSYCFLEGKKNPAGVFSSGGGIITEVAVTVVPCSESRTQFQTFVFTNDTPIGALPPPAAGAYLRCQILKRG